MKKFLLLTFTLLSGIALLFAPGATQAQGSDPLAILLTADGPLTPAMLQYLERGIAIAEQKNAEVIILQLDTPGGSTDLMDSIVQAIRASRAPVVVYVAPRGAIAGSAGTVITLAGHAAAMAPETAIGAASPVGGQGEDIGGTLESKIKEIIKAQVRSLAANRPPEAIALAEDTIENATAVTSLEALEIGLIDFIANDIDDLLQQLDGFTVKVNDRDWTLNTTSAVVTPVNITFIEQLLSILTNPNIVFLLLTVGVQAILIEIGSPGGWVAGVVGVVSLALATYGLGFLPVNWFGLIFVGLAFALFFLEVKAHTLGALTMTGVVSFVIGALVLFNSPNTPDFQRVSLPLVIITSLITAAMFLTLVAFALRAQRTPVATGQEALIGRTGIARSEIVTDRTGLVHLGGESWTAELAEGEDDIAEGQRVEVVEVEGVRLRVKKKK